MYLKLALNKLVDRALNEPVLLTALAADLVMFVASELNFAVDEVSVKAYLAPLVLSAIQRVHVTPNRKLRKNVKTTVDRKA